MALGRSTLRDEAHGVPRRETHLTEGGDEGIAG